MEGWAQILNGYSFFKFKVAAELQGGRHVAISIGRLVDLPRLISGTRRRHDYN
jgi:hypothetical protein